MDELCPCFQETHAEGYRDEASDTGNGSQVVQNEVWV
jgi:hypothetical protein